jgi:hypothetical protein
MSAERQAIHDDDVLLRRVYAGGDNYFREDGTATPLAFNLRKSIGEKGLSVDVARMTSLETAVGDTDKFTLCEVSAQHVRSLFICVCHAPEPDNDAHSLIIPFPDKDPCCTDRTGSDKVPHVLLSSSVRDRLARGARKVKL